MAFVYRAAGGVFSIAIVSAVLISGHRIARSHTKSAKANSVTTSTQVVLPPTLLPDCVMPSCPAASAPIQQYQQHGIQVVGGNEARQLLPGPKPLPLPAHTNAIPLRPDGPQLPLPNDPPASAPQPFGVRPPGFHIIDRAMPDSNAEEKEVWRDVLKDLRPHDVRELMRLRQELGRMPHSMIEGLPLGPPAGLEPVPGPIAGNSQNLPFLGSSPIIGPPVAERGALHTIGLSLDAITQAQNVLINNIANATTDGYKRQEGALECAGSLQHDGPGAGARLGAAVPDLSQGKLRRTDRPLDLAIEGDGFFQLVDPHTNLTFYTRCGRFRMNAEGEIMTRCGQLDLRLAPSIKVAAPESEITIATDGTIYTPDSKSAKQDGRDTPKVSRIEIVQIGAATELVAAGNNLFERVDRTPRNSTRADVASHARVRQGYLEESNVDVDRELQQLDRLRRQAHALEMAAQSVPFSGRDTAEPPGVPTTIPGHLAGAQGRETH